VHLFDLKVERPRPHGCRAAGDKEAPIDVHSNVLAGLVLEGGEAEDGDAGMLRAAHHAVPRGEADECMIQNLA